MKKVNIDIYTSPTCGACNMMKKAIEGSKYEEKIVFKSIHGKEGKDNLDFVKNNKFSSIPVIHIYNKESEEFFVGFMPLADLNRRIEKYNIEEV